jgi:photosystem II stability/assembly factor-like uncharacterized protein
MKHIIIFTIILLLSGIIHLGAQTIDSSPDYVKMMNDPNEQDFKKIQGEFNDYFQNRDKGRGTGYKQFKRWESFVGPRIGRSGQLFNIAAKTLEEYVKYTSNFDATTLPANYDPGAWQSIGPSSYIHGYGWNGGLGRVNCIAFHPNDPDIIFAGTPAGGLWKKDGSTLWEPLTDGLPVIGISGIAIDHNNPDIIYILTGDGDGAQTRSIGVLKSLNGGSTWQATGLSFSILDNIKGFKLLMHPTDPQIMFAATTNGIYKTYDGWDSYHWEIAGHFYDIEFKPNNPSVLYAATNLHFWKSIDEGVHWTNSATGLPLVDSYRIAIGVSPDDNNVVYLLYGRDDLDENRSPFVGIYRSYDSGANFTLKCDTPNIIGSTPTGIDSVGQYTWDLSLAVNPTNNHEIHIGGINCWKSTDKGETWTITSYWEQNTPGYEYTHADIHALEYHPANSNKLYCGSDGGVFLTTNHANNWTDISEGLVITQFYRIGTTPLDVNKYAGGTQDNGCNRMENGVFTHDIGADGFECIIDYTNSNIIYESTYGRLYKSIDNGLNFSGSITPDTVNDDIWDAAWIMHPTNPQVLYFGHTDIWKTTDGGYNWSPMGTGNIWGIFDQIAHGVNNLNRIYGNTPYEVYMTNNSGGSWTNITAGLPTWLVDLSYIAVNNSNSATVYVTCSGYVNGEKVYKSTDAGTNWTNISGSLPNIPVNCIVCVGGNDGKLYVGTDVGVFYRDDNIGDWVPFFHGLPNVIVNEMEINQTSNELIAGTFGRGIWKTELYGSSTCPTSLTLNNSNNPPSSNSQFHMASDYIESTRTIYHSIGATVTYRAGDYVVLKDGFETKTDAEFEAMLGPCNQTLMNKQYQNIIHRTSGILEANSFTFPNKK